MLRAVTICIFCIFLVLNLVGVWCLIVAITWYEHGRFGGFFEPFFYILWILLAAPSPRPYLCMAAILYGISLLAIWGLVSELLKRAEREREVRSHGRAQPLAEGLGSHQAR